MWIGSAHRRTASSSLPDTLAWSRGCAAGGTAAVCRTTEPYGCADTIASERSVTCRRLRHIVPVAVSSA